MFILGLTSLLTDISTEMVYPLLPLYLTLHLGVSPAIVGLIEGIAESLASLVKVFSGFLSDRIKRRKGLTVLGYFSSTLGKFFLYLSTSWGGVLVARVIDRFGKGIRTAPRDALIADSAKEERRGRAYGFHRMMDTLGASIGVILAYYFLTIYKGDYKVVFLYSLIPAILAVLVLFFIREKRRITPSNLGSSHLLIRWSGLDRRLKAFLIITSFFTLGNSSNQFLLLRAKNLGSSATTVILLYLVYNLVYTTFSYPLGKLSDKFGRKKLLSLGYLLFGLVYLGFALIKRPLFLWTLFITYGFYIAATEGVEKAFVADVAPGELRATLMGLHATLVGIGLFPASFLAGILWKLWGAPAPFYFGGILGLLAALSLWLFI